MADELKKLNPCRLCGSSEVLFISRFTHECGSSAAIRCGATGCSWDSKNHDWSNKVNSVECTTEFDALIDVILRWNEVNPIKEEENEN